jgi:hypothetical protein
MSFEPVPTMNVPALEASVEMIVLLRTSLGTSYMAKVKKERAACHLPLPFGEGANQTSTWTVFMINVALEA